MAKSDEIDISVPGSATGNGRRNRPLTTLNTAVLAPIPSASERIATTDTTGVAKSARTDSRRSRMSLSFRSLRLWWMFYTAAHLSWRGRREPLRAVGGADHVKSSERRD